MRYSPVAQEEVEDLIGKAHFVVNVRTMGSAKQSRNVFSAHLATLAPAASPELKQIRTGGTGSTGRSHPTQGAVCCLLWPTY